MEENDHTLDEEYPIDYQASDEEEHHITDEDEHHATDEDDDNTDEDDHQTTDEDLHTMPDYEYGNMEISEYRVGGPGALIRNTLKGPGMKITEFRVKSGECWGLTSAVVKEKFSRAGATVGYHAYSITHPLHPIRRKAAKEAERQKKKLAADIRAQRAAKARSTAAGKIAAAREGRIKTLEEGVH